MSTRLQVEPIKRAEHYGLEDALENWETKPKISTHEALCAISMMGGQGFFFFNCKGSCDKNSCKCKKNGRQSNSKCHPSNKVCVNQTAQVKCTNKLLIISCPIPELDIPLQNGIPSKQYANSVIGRQILEWDDLEAVQFQNWTSQTGYLYDYVIVMYTAERNSRLGCPKPESSGWIETPSQSGISRLGWVLHQSKFQYWTNSVAGHNIYAHYYILI